MEPPSPTEAVSARYRGLDAWSPAEVLLGLWEAQAAAVAAVLPALPRIEAACVAAVPRLAQGGRLAYAGAGTSARIAALDGSELPPTFDFPADRILLLIAGGQAALRASIENAEDDAPAGRAAVAEHALGERDVLLAIAASGATPFTVAAMREARARGALTVGIAGVPGSALLDAAEHPILVATGAEPIAGSTRLKAGTAHKVVLNLFSTLLMIRLGRVHDGMMVDMQPRNEKLRRRAVAMVRRIAGGDAADGPARARRQRRQRQARRAAAARPRCRGGRTGARARRRAPARGVAGLARMTALHATRLFDGERFHEHVAVSLEGSRIAAMGADPRAEHLAPEWLLVPGFVDLQVNGAGGVLFNHTTSVAGLSAIAEALARVGTTSLLATLVSARDKIAPALAATAAAIEAGVAGVLGTHIEGPFLNPARRGAHPLAAIVGMGEADAMLLSAPHPGVRLVTLAPECVLPAHVSRLAGAGVRVFAGHTEASYEQATEALAAGVAGFTHLFNAMSQFGSRAPGCVGAALAHETACAGIICDGLHVHPASLRVAYAAMGAARLFLVSDSMPTAASDTTSFVWDGETVTLSGDRLARQDGTLAGAHLTMAEAVARAVRLCAIPLGDALRMATSTPARHAGATHLGHIAPGLRADLVALDPALRVAAVWQAGRRIV